MKKSFSILRAALFCAFLAFTGFSFLPLTAEETVSGYWNAVDYGAVPDGETDCTTAIQNALDEAGRAGGGKVLLPSGRFSVRGNLSIPGGVTLEGTYSAAITIVNRDQPADGTILLAYAGRGSNEGPAFIMLAGSNATLKGVSVIYPEWDRRDVPPVPYPPCVESHDAENVAVLDCCLLNPYEGIKFVHAPRHLVRNITGYPIWRGLFVDQCYDIGHIENIHYWPFGIAYNPKDPYCEWINLHGVAFELARTDWHYVSNTFCFGYGVGYKFSDHGNGGTNGNFLGLGADSCRRAVLVEAAQPQGLLITNGEFVGRWTSSDSVCLEITDTTAGKVSLTNCSFWGPINTCIQMNAPGGQLTVNACHFENWDILREGSPAIRLESGKSIISASTFQDDGTCVSVGSKVRSAILNANQGKFGFIWKSDSEDASVNAFGNEEKFAPVKGDALDSYTVSMDGSCDSLLLRNFYAYEKAPNGSFRWSAAKSEVKLFLNPEKAADVEFDLDVPEAALAKTKKAGIYFGDARVAPIEKSGRNTYQFQIPPQTSGEAVLEVRVHGWVPGGSDIRKLGVQLYGFRVKSDGFAGGKVFDVNQQEWKEN